MNRNLKQITILGIPIFFIIIFLIVIWLILNPKEEEVIVNIPYKDFIETSNQKVLYNNGLIDYYIEIQNPNIDYAFSSFKYSLKEGDKILKTGRSYLLPAEKKPLIIKNIQTQKTDFSIEFYNIEVKERSSIIGNTQLSVKNKQFWQESINSSFKHFLEAEIQNRSSYFLESIDILIVVKNTKDEIFAINTSEINSLPYNKQRRFKVEWTNANIPEDPIIEITAISNFYDGYNAHNLTNDTSSSTEINNDESEYREF